MKDPLKILLLSAAPEFAAAQRRGDDDAIQDLWLSIAARAYKLGFQVHMLMREVCENGLVVEDMTEDEMKELSEKSEKLFDIERRYAAR